MRKETALALAWGIGVLCLAAIFGAISAHKDWFPGKQIGRIINRGEHVAKVLLERPKPISIRGDGPVATTHDAAGMSPGLTFVVGVGEDMLHRVQVVRADGTPVHEWRADWFEIWPDDGFLPEARRPRRQPGASIHGTQVLPDGSLLLNFEYLSTLKLDACSNVVWKLGNMGHHSVDVQSDGTIWVGANTAHPKGTAIDIPGARAPLAENTAQKISAEGEILETFSTLEIFREHDLPGYLFATTQVNGRPVITKDPMHLNDVEIFPEHLPEGLFRHGDIMLSLRNINTVVVLDGQTRRIKHLATGQFLRQHDPDFTSANSYTLFDNNNLAAARDPAVKRSRILEVTAAPGGGVERTRELFRGPESPDFFSAVKGRHQALPNGNVLLVSSEEGRVLELTADGRLVWEYRNILDDGYRGLMTEAQRLPPEMDEDFFRNLAAECTG